MSKHEKAKPEVEEIVLEQEEGDLIEAAAAAAEEQLMTAAQFESESLRKQVAELQDKYTRLLAESENARKRMQKERQQMTQYAVANVLVDFLHPLDQLQNALKFADQMSDEVRNWAIGFKMIATLFNDILTSNGVVPFDAKTGVYDYNEQEAIEMVETDEYPPGTIIEQCLCGYRMGERVIRHAKVKVAKQIALEASPEDKEEQKEQSKNQ